jgi:hypothetical protein
MPANRGAWTAFAPAVLRAAGEGLHLFHGSNRHYYTAALTFASIWASFSTSDAASLRWLDHNLAAHAIKTSGDIRAIQPNFRRPHQFFFGYPPIAVPKLIRITLAAVAASINWSESGLKTSRQSRQSESGFQHGHHAIPFVRVPASCGARYFKSDSGYVLLRPSANKIIQIISAFMPRYSSGHRAS